MSILRVTKAVRYWCKWEYFYREGTKGDRLLRENGVRYRVTVGKGTGLYCRDMVILFSRKADKFHSH